MSGKPRSKKRIGASVDIAADVWRIRALEAEKLIYIQLAAYKEIIGNQRACIKKLEQQIEDKAAARREESNASEHDK